MTAINVGDEVRNKHTQAEHIVTCVELDGRLEFEDGTYGAPHSYTVTKPARRNPTPPALEERVRALEQRADRHIFHITRVAGVATSLTDRVSAIETAAAPLAPDPARPVTVLPAGTARWEYTHAEWGERPPSLCAYPDDRIGSPALCEVAIPDDMPADVADHLVDALRSYATQVEEWARIKRAREDSSDDVA